MKASMIPRGGWAASALWAFAIASETIMAYALDGARKDWSATLRDLTIRSMDA
jgi:hypothetical protein